jgi:uncharacterized damage-inducible protein DinB
MHTGLLVLAVTTSLVVPGIAAAQAQDPMTASVKVQFNVVKDFVVRSAQKVPEDLYAFRATPEVRTMGELYGHIADAFFGMCSTAAGAKPPRSGIEKSAKTKAELVKALQEGAAYCESVMASMDDKKGSETVQFYFGATPRLSVLYFNVAHGYEHYGNLVTYMRLKGIVPPSSEGATK